VLALALMANTNMSVLFDSETREMLRALSNLYKTSGSHVLRQLVTAEYANVFPREPHPKPQPRTPFCHPRSPRDTAPGVRRPRPARAEPQAANVAGEHPASTVPQEATADQPSSTGSAE
jgi:hypothetical protein